VKLAAGRTTAGPLARFPATNTYATLTLSVWHKAREIAAKLRAFKPDVIVACTASPTDIPAAAVAAVMTGTPLVAYLFDDPVFQWVPGHLRRFAAWCEPLWSRVAAAAIAPNEFMAQDFVNRTRAHVAIVRNPVADTAIDFHQRQPPTAHLTVPLTIVYTG